MFSQKVQVSKWLNGGRRNEKITKIKKILNTGLYASEHFETEAVPVIHAYMKRKEKDKEDLKVADVFEGIRFGETLYRDDVNKISYILSSYQDYLDASEEFPDLKSGTWGGKGETALFGDAKVDIPMLDYCHMGIAMGNGGEEIKAMADDITDDVERDGLYKAFQKYGLIRP